MYVQHMNAVAKVRFIFSAWRRFGVFKTLALKNIKKGGKILLFYANPIIILLVSAGVFSLRLTSGFCLKYKNRGKW